MLKRRLFGVVPLWLILILAITVVAVAAFLAQSVLDFSGTSQENPDVSMSGDWTCITFDFGTCVVTDGSTLNPSFAFSDYDDDTYYMIIGDISNDGSNSLISSCDTSVLEAASHVSAVSSYGECGVTGAPAYVYAMEFEVAMGDAVPGASFGPIASGILVEFATAP